MRDVRIRPEQLADTIKKELDDLAEDTTDTVKEKETHERCENQA